MERELATERLGLLHAAQGVFYAGGPDDALRELLRRGAGWHDRIVIVRIFVAAAFAASRMASTSSVMAVSEVKFG